MPDHLVDIIKCMYKDLRIYLAGNNSKLEIVSRGLRQRCRLSLTLFNVFIDDVLCEWKNCLPVLKLGFQRL